MRHVDSPPWRGKRPSAIGRADPAATGHAPTFFGDPTKSRRSCHHQGAVLMRDNVAVKINRAPAPKIEMATSHEHSAPTSIFICGNFVATTPTQSPTVGVCRSVVEHDVEQR